MKSNNIGGIDMAYTIEQLLNMDFESLSDNELVNIVAFVNEHYFEDSRYSEVLDEVKAEQEARID